MAVVWLLCGCCVAVVWLLCGCCVVEWLYYSKRTNIVRSADLSDFSFIFVGKMRVFVSRPMKIVTFLWKNDYSPKRVVDFPWKRDTCRNTIMEIVEDFDEKSYNNNGEPWKSSRILRVKFKFLTFFFNFSFFFIFFHFLSCSFSLLGASISSRFLLAVLM